jgi:hypothetical protein
MLHRNIVPNVIYKDGETRAGLITTMLTPVRCRREPQFGVRQAMWAATLTFAGMAVLRLLLAQ